MAVQVINFPAKYLENSQTTQYSAPVGTITVIDKLSASNNSASTVTVSVNLVPTGGSAGATNLVTKDIAIPAGRFYLFPELIGQTVANQGFISAVASAASAVVITGTFRNITNA